MLPETIASMVNKCGCPLEKAILPATENVARALGLYPTKGVLAEGSDADIVLLDMDRIEEGYYPCGLQESVVDYYAVFDALKVIPQDRLPLLREEAIPELAKQDQEFIKQFFV